MTGHSESQIEKAVKTYAQAKGWAAYKWNSASQRGVPDDLFFQFGTVVIVEFKREGELPTPYQAAVHRRLKAKGHVVHVVDSIEGGRALFDELTKEHSATWRGDNALLV